MTGGPGRGGSALTVAGMTSRTPIPAVLAAALAGAAALVLVVPPDSARAAPGWRWPVSGPLLTPYRNGDDPYAGGQHRGIDIGASVGAPIVAATDGRVTFAGVAGSSGLTVAIRTADGRYDTSYLHLGSAAVRAGERVSGGDRVGAVGTSGRRSVAAPHLHFGVREAEARFAYRDPLAFLPPPAGGPEPGAPRPAPVPAPESGAPSLVPESAEPEAIVLPGLPAPVALVALTAVPPAAAPAPASPAPLLPGAAAALPSAAAPPEPPLATVPPSAAARPSPAGPSRTGSTPGRPRRLGPAVRGGTVAEGGEHAVRSTAHGRTATGARRSQDRLGPAPRQARSAAVAHPPGTLTMRPVRPARPGGGLDLGWLAACAGLVALAALLARPTGPRAGLRRGRALVEAPSRPRPRPAGPWSASSIGPWASTSPRRSTTSTPSPTWGTRTRRSRRT